jgi:hypothetical protein
MKIQDLIPNVEYGSGQYTFKNIFYKYNLNTPIDEKYLKVYSMADGETLEGISYALYDDTIYFWTIMIVNGIFDPIFDLPLPEEAIQQIAREKSTINGILNISLYSTNYDILTDENDVKRNIKVIKPGYLGQFLTEIIRQSVNNI